MKKFLSILLVLVISVMALPMLVSAVTYDSSTELDNKNTTTWAKIPDGRLGELSYKASGPTFDFLFTATGMEAEVAYSLIYYANPYPGNNPGLLIGTGTSDTVGALTISDTPDLGMNLPTPPDSNMIVSHSGPPDNYPHPFGAKIWLVPSDCYSGTSVSVWSPERFLFETDLITYTDTNLGGGTGVSLTTTITEPVSTIGVSITPDLLNFGSVAIGSCSTDVPITVTNTGNVPITVTAIPSSGFYSDCMQLKPSGGTYTSSVGWESPKIYAGTSLIVYAKVCPTIAYSGVTTGNIDFMTEFAP